MKAFIVFFALVLAMAKASPHHTARHHEEEETQELDAQIRHHIYMPLPLAYRESRQPPVIKYVPVYANPADPRFINYNVGANANLGFASAGFQHSLGNDQKNGLFGTGLTFEGGLGLGPNYGNYYENNPSVTYLKPGPGATTSGYTYVQPASRSPTPVFRAPVAPLVPGTAQNVPLYPTFLPNKKFARTIMYPYYV